MFTHKAERYVLFMGSAKLLIKLFTIVPDAPKVVVFPTYSAETGQIISLKTQWIELVNSGLADCCMCVLNNLLFLI